MPLRKISLAAALLASPLARADTVIQTAAAELPAVVVTGSPLSAPLTVDVDTKAPRQPLPAHDGADYLKTIPGFSVTRKGGADGDPVFRGMTGSRLTVLADDQVMLGGCNARMDAPTAYIHPETFDRLLVIKGPETVLQGPMSSGATIRFEREPQRFTEAGYRLYGSLGVASFERHDEILDARIGNPDGYVGISGSNSQSGDYEDGDGNPVHSRYHRYSAGAALGWTPDDDSLLELSASHGDGYAAYADRAMDGTRFRRDAATVRAEKKGLSPLLEKIEFSAYTGTVDHIMDDQTLRTPGSMGYADLQRDTHGGRLATALRLAAPSLLTVGADVQANAHASRSAKPGQPYTPWQDDAEFRQAGLFAELQQDLDAQLRLVSGYRVDRWRATDQRPVIAGMMMVMPNPTAGQTREETLQGGFVRLERKAREWPLLAYAGIGHAERFPDYWELIAKQGEISLSAFDTRPEQTDQLDTGLLYRGTALKASASLFYGQARDFILIDYASKASGATRNVNARSFGGELEAELALAESWALSSALSYVRGDNESDGRPLPQQPPLEARLGLGYDNRQWSAGLLGRFVAAQHRYDLDAGSIVGRDLGPTPGFAVFSLNAGWRPQPALLLAAGVDNLFDRRYAEFISRAGGDGMGGAIAGYAQTDRVNEPGRTLWLKLTLELD